MYEIGRTVTSHPDLDDDLKEVYEFLIRGCGVAVVRNFPVVDPIDEIERMTIVGWGQHGWLASVPANL